MKTRSKESAPRFRLFLPGIVMRVVFSDDSGLSGVSEPITVAAAVMFDIDGQWDPFISDVESMMADVLKDPGKAADRELKGDKLARGLRSGRGRRSEAEGLLTGALSLLAKHNIPVFYGSVDRAGYERGKEYFRGLRKAAYGSLKTARSVQDIAFADCLAHVNRYVGTFRTKEKVLWIADAAGLLQMPKKVELAFFRLQQLLREKLVSDKNNLKMADDVILSVGVGPAGLSMQPSDSHIVDTIYFGASSDSRALQLADLCCSVITAHLRVTYDCNRQKQSRKELGPYYSLISTQVVNDGTPPALSRSRRWF